jgi:hypothetical protein
VGEVHSGREAGSHIFVVRAPALRVTSVGAQQLFLAVHAQKRVMTLRRQMGARARQLTPSHSARGAAGFDFDSTAGTHIALVVAIRAGALEGAVEVRLAVGAVGGGRQTAAPVDALRLVNCAHEVDR